MIARYTGVGNYNAPTATSLASSFTGGSVFQRPFLNVTGQLTIYGSAAYTVVGHSFRFDAGTQIQDVMDFNTATGLKSFLVTGRRPSATLVIADEAGGNAGNITGDRAELFAAMNAQTNVAWSCAVGSASGEICTFSIPYGRIVNIQSGNESGHRTLELTITPTGLSGATPAVFTNESEFLISIT